MKAFSILTVFTLFCAVPALANDLGPEAFLKACSADPQASAAFDCGCLTSKLKEAHAATPNGSWEQAHGMLQLGGAKECVQPERIRAQTLQNCTEKHYDKNPGIDRTKVGKERFCGCVAENTVKRLDKVNIDRIVRLSTDTNSAMLDCKASFMSAK